MSEDTLTHTEQAMAYYGHDLNPAEAAEFEKHLVACEECKRLLAEAQAKLPLAEGLLAQASFRPARTVEEQVRRFDAIVAAERAARARRWRVARYAFAAGLAALIGFAAFEVLRPPRPGQLLAAPPAPPIESTTGR